MSSSVDELVFGVTRDAEEAMTKCWAASTTFEKTKRADSDFAVKD